MKYGLRVGIGVVLGAALAVGLTTWLDKWWIGALAGGLGGPLVFLATFFAWSADRPEEGYEQVLFDRPNTLLSGVMLVAFVGLAFGAGWLLSPAAGLSPEEQAALAQMDGSRALLGRLADNYAAANAAFIDGQAPGDLAPGLEEAKAAHAALAALEPPESLYGHKEPLLKAARAVEAAFDALGKCVGGDTSACLDARIGHADVVRGLQGYDEVRGAS
jgi:hypothetical protein